MRHATLLKFPEARTPRLPWDDADASTAARVRDLIALAPILGRRNPASMPNVLTYMRDMIGPGPEGGVERDPPRRRPRAAKAQLPARTVQQVFERLHISDPAQRAEMRPFIQGYLRSRHA